MSNIIKVNEDELNRSAKLRDVMADLIEFDTSSLDIAKVICFNKKDIIYDHGAWYSIIYDGLGLHKTHPKVKFNVEITIVTYSQELQKYETSEYTLKNIYSESIVSKLFYQLKDMEFADLAKIDAITASKWWKKISYICYFCTNLKF